MKKTSQIKAVLKIVLVESNILRPEEIPRKLRVPTPPLFGLRPCPPPPPPSPSPSLYLKHFIEKRPRNIVVGPPNSTSGIELPKV